MIIVKLQGGLGNQMFQYSIGKILAKKNNTNLLLDIEFFVNSVGNKEITARDFSLAIFKDSNAFAFDNDKKQFLNPGRKERIKKKFKLKYSKIFKEKEIGFDKEVFSLNSPVYLIGYFQSYKYFETNSKFVKNLFRVPTSKLDKDNCDLIRELKSTNSIAVHIRRGDYISNKEVKDIHGICDKEYYIEAMDILNSKVKNPVFYFFSDDVNWVKEEFSKIESKFFIEHNQGSESWKDLILMKYCQHNIIANSSFSWWGAWLNDNPNKFVIAPKMWFKNIEMNNRTKDLIPSSWLRI